MNYWVVSRVGNVVTLNTGDEIDLDSFPGNGWTVNRCNNIADNIQQNWLDTLVDRNALPADDPDKSASAATLAATYGGWFVELNTKGGKNEIRLRDTLISVFPQGASFNFTLTEVAR